MKPHKTNTDITNLINRTHLIITKQNVVSPTNFILITISGGQDSLCLFFIFLTLKKQWKWYFGLLYCNHFWQIDSFYTNSLVFKLGFFFLIPAYLSLPSENIFSEQKSRTWRYSQFERISNFYNYDSIFTGHTSTDRIETILIQLLRGTSTRGLSTLNWKRPISRKKPNLLTLPVVSSSKLSFYGCAPVALPHCRAQQGDQPWVDNLAPKGRGNVGTVRARQNTKLTKSSKNKNVLFYIEFPNQFFLKFQINFLKFCFFDKKNTTQVFFNQNIKQKLVFRFNTALQQSSQNSKQSDKLHVLTPYSMLQSVLFFGDYKKSRYRKLINNKITTKTNKSNFLLKKILVRNKIYLLPTIKVLRPTSQSRTKLSKKGKTVQLQTKSDSKRTDVYLIHFSTHFVRCSPFISTRTRIFKMYLDPDQLSTRAKKVKFLFYKNYKVGSQFDFETKSKSYLLSKKNKYSSFSFETIILNEKPSKILIKYLKPTYWVKLKKKIKELEIDKLKNIITFPSFVRSPKQGLFFQNKQRRQSSIKSDSFSFKDPQAALASTESALFFYKKDFEFLNPMITYYHKQAKKLKLSRGGETKTYNFNKYKNSAFFLNTHSGLKSKLLIKSTIKTQKQKKKLNDSFFLNQQSLNKNHIFEKNRNKVNFLKLIDLSFALPLCLQTKLVNIKAEQLKDKINVYQSYLKYKRNQELGSLALDRCLTPRPPLPLPARQWEGARLRSFAYLPKGQGYPPLVDHPISRFTSFACKPEGKGTNYFIWSIQISQLRDDRLIQQDKHSLVQQMTNNFHLSLPNQKAFGYFEVTDKQCFIVRPILFISRFDLKKICAFWELPLYPDQTNEKLIYFRNRIRKQLLPLLRFFFNPQIDKLFLQFSEITTAEQGYLDVLSSRLQEEFQLKKINAFELNISAFIFIPIAIQRRLLKQFLDQYLIKKVKFFHIENLLNVLAKRRKHYSNTYAKDADNGINLKNWLIQPETITEFSFRSLIIFQVNEEKERFSIFYFNEYVLSFSSKSQFFLGYYCNKFTGQNLFSGKNQLEIPKIFFFSGVGACFITSRRLTILQ